MTRAELPGLVDRHEPISWCDPSCLSIEPVSIWRFMAVGFVSILVVAVLLVALLAEGTPWP